MLLIGRPHDRPAGRSPLPHRARLRGRRRALWLTNGSAGIAPSDWAVDLMEKGAAARSGASTRAAALPPGSPTGWPFPFGLHRRRRRRDRQRKLAPSADPASTATRHASRCSRSCRAIRRGLSPAADGGAWLALFAPRNRLIEFVLQEDDYRADMMREVPRESVDRAGACRRERSFLEPLQCGGVTHDGHPQAMVADPLLRPGRPARSPTCGRLPATTAAPTARATASPASVEHRRHGCWSPPRAATPCSRIDLAERRAALMADHRMRKITKAYRGVPAVRKSISTCARARSTPCSARTAPANRR